MPSNWSCYTILCVFAQKVCVDKPFKIKETYNRTRARYSKERVRGGLQIGRVIRFFAFLHKRCFFDEPFKTKETYERMHARCPKGRVRGGLQIGRIIGFFAFLHKKVHFAKPFKMEDPQSRSHTRCRLAAPKRVARRGPNPTVL